jgi:hypothetical protein
MLHYLDTYTRPNTSVAWHSQALPELNAPFVYHKVQHYITPMKLVNDWTFSEDNLTLSGPWTWLNQAALDEYLADPVVIEYRAAIAAYNDSVGIVKTTVAL